MRVITKPWELEAERQRLIHNDALLQAICDKNPELQKKADEIHHARLMCGRACGQCIEKAMWQMNIPLPEEYIPEPPDNAPDQ